MKILLDENISVKAKFDFGKNHEVFTVRDMNWLGKKNGELLGLAILNNFEVFITLDKNLKNQQNLIKIEMIFILLLAIYKIISIKLYYYSEIRFWIF